MEHKMFNEVAKLMKEVENRLEKINQVNQELWHDGKHHNEDFDQLTSVSRRYFENLKDMILDFNYYKMPIIDQGRLSKNDNGRYEFHGDSRHVYTCGDRIEFFYYSQSYDEYYWVRSRIEHDGDYYIWGYKDLEMSNLKVRVRRNYDEPGWFWD